MPSNQKLHHAYHRLEFIGDRVLNLIVSRYLYRKFPAYSEGELTNKLRFTSNENLEEIVRSLPEEFRMDLLAFKARFGQDEPASNADAIEALIGNYFLELGLDATTAYVEGIFAGPIDRFDPDTDYISRLKVHSEKERIPLPVYQLVRDETGPDNREIFHYNVQVGGVVLGTGSGSSHEKAKRAAAGEALRGIGAMVDQG
jgi:ribonuclease-3